MTNQENLWSLLRELMFKEISNHHTVGATNTEKLDLIILTLLIDYRTKSASTNEPNTSGSQLADIDNIITDLDEALEYNREQFEQIKLLFK